MLHHIDVTHTFLSIRTQFPSSRRVRSTTVHLVCARKDHVCATENTAGANRCHRPNPVQQSLPGQRLTVRSGRNPCYAGAPIGNHSTRPGG
jgi:hypothetical protein